MKKIYQKPETTATEINMEQTLLAGSLAIKGELYDDDEWD